MKLPRKLVLLTAAAFALIFAIPAEARDKDRRHGRDRGRHYYRDHDHRYYGHRHHYRHRRGPVVVYSNPYLYDDYYYRPYRPYYPRGYYYGRPRFGFSFGF